MSEGEATHALWIRVKSTTGPWIASPELRPRLTKDAKKAGTNLNDVAIGILSKHYGVAFVPSGRQTKVGDNAGSPLNLRIGEALHQAIRDDAHNSAVTNPVKAIEILCRHYKLAVPRVAVAA